MADGGLAPHLGRPAVGAVRREHARAGQFIRTLGWRQAARARPRRDVPGRRAPRSTPTPTASTPGSTSTTGTLSLPFVVTGLKAGLGGIGGYTLEPWTPVDTSTWQKVQAWQLGGNFDTEVFRLLADAQLGDPAKTDELFPAYGADDAGHHAERAQGLRRCRARRAAGSRRATRRPARRPGRGGRRAAPRPRWRDLVAHRRLDPRASPASTRPTGSPATTASARTTGSSGRRRPRRRRRSSPTTPTSGSGCRPSGSSTACTAGRSAPACPYDVVGVSFPGVPGGRPRAQREDRVGRDERRPRRRRTSSAIQPDPADADHYLSRASPSRSRSAHETIKVAGGATSTFDVRIDPPRPDPQRRRHAASRTRRSLALRWTATDEVDGTLEAFFSSTARPLRRVPRGLRAYGSPSQNFVYADVDGHIGYVLPGPSRSARTRTTTATAPVRRDGHARVDRPHPVRRTCPGSWTRRAGSS